MARSLRTATGEAVLVDEATKQDLIRSARLHGDFRDAESAINRSGKSLDWQERVFGYELKGTEGDSTHALIIMLKGDTEEELDDAVVSVYFKKTQVVDYEITSVLVTQILERDGNRVVETATADLVSGTGARVRAKPDGQPESGVVGKLTGRGNLEQLATIESFVPPADRLPPATEGGAALDIPVKIPLPENFPKPGQCSLALDPDIPNYDHEIEICKVSLQAEYDAIKLGWAGYINAVDSYNKNDMVIQWTILSLTSGLIGAIATCAKPGALCGIAAADVVVSAGVLGYSVTSQEALAKYAKEIRFVLNEDFWYYKNDWRDCECGVFPYAWLEDVLPEGGDPYPYRTYKAFSLKEPGMSFNPPFDSSESTSGLLQYP